MPYAIILKTIICKFNAGVMFIAIHRMKLLFTNLHKHGSFSHEIHATFQFSTSFELQLLPSLIHGFHLHLHHAHGFVGEARGLAGTGGAITGGVMGTCCASSSANSRSISTRKLMSISSSCKSTRT